MKNRYVVGVCVAAMVVVSCVVAEGADAKAEGGRTTTFEAGGWDPAKWTPLRLPAQEAAVPLVQKDGCIGTGSFSKEDIKKGMDNALLMTDSNTTEGEIEVTFSIGKEHGTAPGVFLSPTCKEGVLETAIGIFVADYTMAVWKVGRDPDSGKTKYVHLARFARWQDPEVKHVLRCRYSKKRRSMALRIDDSDVIVFRFPDHEINSRVGIWGCHGTCNYYRIRISEPGTLEWSGQRPEGQE